MSVPAATPPPPLRPSWRRHVRRIILALVALSILLLLAVLGGIASLRSTAVRQAILARVADYAARELGLPLTAEDFRFLGWSGIEVQGLRLGVPGAPPLLTAERAVARVDLFSLREETAVIRSLEVFSPRVDLSAPVPEIPESEGPPGFEVQRINLHQATVIGAPLEGAAAEWVRSWQIAGIEARGSFRNGPWNLTVDTADARIDRPGLDPLALRIAGRVDSRPGEPLRIERLQATGDGLRLTGSGRLGLEEGGPVAAVFDVEADPKLLGAGIPAGGLVRARGDLRLPESTGRIVMDVQAVPAEALRPYLEDALFADLSLAGTVADGQANLTFGPGDLARIAGEALLVWRREDRRFAQAEAGIVPGKEVPLRLAFSADLLSDSPGRRHAEGVITGSGWAELADGVADGIEAEVRLPDVAAALAEARKLWPRLVPALPEGLPIRGALAATARLEGPLTTPDATLDATWNPDPASRVHLRAKGRPTTWTGNAEAELSNLSMSLLSPPAEGLLSGHLALSGSPQGYRMQAEIQATAVALAPPDQSPPSPGGGWKGDGRGGQGVRTQAAHLTADGILSIAGKNAPTFTGSTTLEATALEAPDLARIETARLSSDGTLHLTPLTFRGTVHLAGTGLDAPGKVQVPGFEATVEGDLAADPSAIRARLGLDAPRILLTEPATEISNLHLQAEADALEARISALSGSLPEERTFAASGRFTLDPLLDEADLDLRLARPVDAVHVLELSASLRSGVVGISAPKIETDAGPANLRATVPLGALEQIPALTEGLRGLPIERTPGPIALRLEAPELDSRPLLAALGLEPRPEHVQAGLLADLTFDPATPAAGRGEIRLDDLKIETPDARVAAEGPVTARLGDGTLEVLPVRLRIDSAGIEGAGLDLHGKADLDPHWRLFDDPPEKLVTRIAAEAGGTLEAGLLNPYLEGGIAAGTLTLRANASGRPDDLTADVRASGRGASFVWPSPYVTRIQDPEIALSCRQDRWTLDTGKAVWNGGTLDLAGGGGPEGIGLDVGFAGVRYRVDYGASTQLSGRLALRVPPGEEARSSLSGRITVDRAVLDRDINLDREVLSLLRAPDSTPGTEETFLSRLDLDLQVATVDGVRIRNNVADLRASWRPLTITGTAEVPVLRGRIDIDPGGRLLIYTQTVRIDRGSLVFTGDPLLDPRTDFSTTSTLQDSTITQLRGEASPLALLDRPKELEDEPGLGETLTAGLAGYYGARVVSKVGESLGLQRLTVSPVLVFEEDPSARLIVGTDLSQNVSYTLSVDLRNAGRQSHLLSLHGFRALPGMELQGFSNDESQEGVSLQQALTLGGSEPRQAGSRLRRLRVSAPRGQLWNRLLRRSIRLQKRDPVPESAAFDIEVDLAETLRRRGYPDPQIRVEVTPTSRSGWVDIAVTVEPGPHATFLFEGDRLAKADRTAITTLYRLDFYEPIALEEMKKEAVRAFRRRGHLDPRVEIEVRRDKPDERTVILHAEAGPRTEVTDLEIAGFDAATALLAARRFPPETLARAELAAGLPDADRRLLDALRRLGFPSARIAGRELDRKKLTVRVEPGPRQLLGSVDIAGVEAGERERLLSLLPVRSGGPARLDLVSEGALRLERDLEARGYPDASVGVAAQPSGGRLNVLYKVDPGPKVQIAGIDFAGERWSRPSRLERAAGLRPGAPLSNAEVEEARARLFQTGVFSRVSAEVDRAEEATAGEARVTFSLAERPRFRLGYGARWQSGRGTSAVVDAVDGNFLRRGMTLGLLGLYEPDDRSGRLYLHTGTLLGTDVSLETYLQARRTRLPEEGFVEDSREASLQLARPFGRRTTGRVYARYRTTHLFEEEPDPFFPIDLEISRPYMGTQLLQDGRDDRIDPTRGYFASADLSGSGAFLGSDFSYARLFTQLQLHRSFALAGRSVIWAQSFRAGLARPFSGQELLREERFFAGGEFSVRGYETDSLGPEEVLGSLVRPLGGEALLVINEELRVRLPWDLTGLLFLDAGQVWQEPGDVDWSLAKSLGLGLRARTPVGLLRFDAGFPLDRREGDESYRLYFGFGNAF